MTGAESQSAGPSITIVTVDGEGCGTPRTPVLALTDALRSAGAEVTVARCASDAEIDSTLTDPAALAGTMVIAAASDGEIRAVARRMVKIAAPRPGQRPDHLPEDRTIPDLAPVAILRMGPEELRLASSWGLPTSDDPAQVAQTALAGVTRRFDLLRTDAGSVTLGSAVLGDGQDLWYGRVEVDDTVLSDGTEPISVCVVANAATSEFGLPLASKADPADGALDVAIAVPVRRGKAWEVRRVRGRAVAVTPRDETPYVDDGVSATLAGKRTWWVERGAWAVRTLADQAS